MSKVPTRVTTVRKSPATKPRAPKTAHQKFSARLRREGKAYGRSCGEGAVARKKAGDLGVKQVDLLFGLLHTLAHDAPADILASPWHLLAEFAPVIKEAKVSCKAAAKARASEEGIEGDALKRLLKGSTKGLKDRMPDMNNFLELVNVDLDAARESVTLQTGKRKLVWAEAAAVWKAELQCHVSEIMKPTYVGIDVEDPRKRFVLGADWRKTHEPILDDDGEELSPPQCDKVFGPNGAKRVTRVLVSEEPKGPLYDEVREEILHLGDLLSNNTDFIRKSEDEERADYPEFILPHDGKVEIPEEAEAAFLGMTLVQYRDAMPKKG